MFVSASKSLSRGQDSARESFNLSTPSESGEDSEAQSQTSRLLSTGSDGINCTRRVASLGLIVVGSILLVVVVVSMAFTRTTANANQNEIIGLAETEKKELAAIEKAIQEFHKSDCKSNTFYLDWGSTGIKVFPVHYEEHHGDSPALDDTVPDKIKLEALDTKSSLDMIKQMIEMLHGRLHADHIGAVVHSTAGFRLEPDDATKVWEFVRKTNDQVKLFQDCSADNNKVNGCYTLSGSVEGADEMHAMFDSERLDGTLPEVKPVGMASCGGASIQMAIEGADKDILQKCKKDLEPLDTSDDPKRAQYYADFDANESAVVLSWLADHDEHKEYNKAQPDDYQAGGVNEMRVNFDLWLANKGHETNPCLSNLIEAKEAFACDEYVGKSKPCVTDSWGGYMTRLPGNPSPTTEDCQDAVDLFLNDDLMLSRWKRSENCQKLTSETLVWRFLTSFSRETQLGADISSETKWKDVKEQSSAYEFESEADVADGAVGEKLTSTLLVGFLKAIGLHDSAKVEAAKGDWSSIAMHKYRLRKGWIKDCPVD